MFEEGWANDVQVQLELPLTEKLVKVEVICKSRRNGI